MPAEPLLNTTGIWRLWTRCNFLDLGRLLGRRSTKARRLGAAEEEELELQRAMFVLQPSAWTRIRHTGRCLRAHWRFRRSYGQRIRATGLGRS